MRSIRRPGFTLVELLVVIGIIVVFVALLMPALRRAREQAVDIRDAAIMRQCLMAIFMYNNEYRRGLQNYDPDCPFWGVPWPNYSVTPWVTEPHYNLSQGGISNYHVWAEHRSAKCYWRGYLQQANLAGPEILGCSAYDFRGEPFIASYNTPGGVSPTNQVETNRAQDSFRKSPAFVWYGPGSSNYSGNNVAVYVGGNLTWGNQPYPHYTSYRKRGPLIVCPQVRQGLFTFIGGVPHVPFTTPHRWRLSSASAGSLVMLKYAENVGFSDGSVQFYSSDKGGVFRPE